MLIKERAAGDMKELRRRASGERRAEQKDRLMAAVLAIEGMQTADIQRVLGRSRGFVQRWVYAYRDKGIDAVIDKPRGGKLAKLNGENLARLKVRIDAGPTEADKVCTLRGKDIQRIAKDELGTDVSLSSVYRTLEQMGYSSLRPRPRHEKQDPAVQQKFKEKGAPLL
jgi:transposase